MLEASTVDSTAKTVPNLGTPLGSLGTEVLGEWDNLRGLVSPTCPQQREELERFRRRIEHLISATTATIETTTLGQINTPTLIYCDSNARADLLPLKAGYRVPLHDHPGSVVILVPLTGRVIVSNYQLPEVVVSGYSVSLHNIGSNLLNPGDFCVRLPTYGNAHKLSALIDAVLLELIVSPRPSQSHHRFVPLGQTSAVDGSLSCFPIGQPEVSPPAEPCNAISS